MDRPLLIFSGQSNRPLAQAIAEALGLPLGKSTTLRFANDNLFVRYEESLREGDVFIVQSFVPPVQDHLMELLLLADAARRSSAGRINAVIPYFGYARQDKQTEGREPISSRNSAWVNSRYAAMRMRRQSSWTREMSTATTLAGSRVRRASALSPAEQIETSVAPGAPAPGRCGMAATRMSASSQS